MIARVAHATTPGHLVVLEEELPPDLSEVTTRQHIPARFDLLDEASEGDGHEGALLVCGHVARVQGARHAEEVVEFPCRVGVDGKRTLCFSLVHGYEVGLTATDDDDFGGWREGGERSGGDGG